MTPSASEARAEARTPTLTTSACMAAASLDAPHPLARKWSCDVVNPILRVWCDARQPFLRIVLSSGVEPAGQRPMTTPRSFCGKWRVTALRTGKMPSHRGTSSPTERTKLGFAEPLSKFQRREHREPTRDPHHGASTARTRAGEIGGAVQRPNHAVVVGHHRHGPDRTEQARPFPTQANGQDLPRTDKGETP